MPTPRWWAHYALGKAAAVVLTVTCFPERCFALDQLAAQAAIIHHRPARGDLIARATPPAGESEWLRSESVREGGRVRFPAAIAPTDAELVSATTLTVERAVHPRRCRAPKPPMTAL